MNPSIVDIAGREKASLLLRRWLHGKITNYEVDDAWPWDSYDRGIVDIGKETWRYYDDFPEQVLSPQSLSQNELVVLHRCLRFLDSKEPYTPPEPELLKDKSLRTLLFGKENSMTISTDEKRKKWWPFSDEAQSMKAAQKP